MNKRISDVTSDSTELHDDDDQNDYDHETENRPIPLRERKRLLEKGLRLLAELRALCVSSRREFREAEKLLELAERSRIVAEAAARRSHLRSRKSAVAGSVGGMLETTYHSRYRKNDALARDRARTALSELREAYAKVGGTGRRGSRNVTSGGGIGGNSIGGNNSIGNNGNGRSGELTSNTRDRDDDPPPATITPPLLVLPLSEEGHDDDDDIDDDIDDDEYISEDMLVVRFLRSNYAPWMKHIGAGLLPRISSSSRPIARSDVYLGQTIGARQINLLEAAGEELRTDLTDLDNEAATNDGNRRRRPSSWWWKLSRKQREKLRRQPSSEVAET